MPNSGGSLVAVVVSGGKQYRVEAGDRILVDRLTAEPGAEIALERVLLLVSDGEVKVGSPLLEGVSLTGRVIAHQRGPKIDVLRYKSKKRVRVHRGSRADLTAIEVIGLAGAEPREGKKAGAAKSGAAKSGAAKSGAAKSGAAKSGARASAAARKARASETTEKPGSEASQTASEEPAPVPPRRRRARSGGTEEVEDGA